jgi:urease accessory protein
MMVIQQRCAASGSCDARLVLTYEARRKSRLRARLQSGEEVGLFLERGSVLRDGDHLLSDDGRVVVVVAAAEQVYRAASDDPLTLLRIAYHLGNRHVPVQLGPGWLRFERDPVLRDMLHGLGVQVSAEVAPLEPEVGAYGGGHRHGESTGALAE